MVSLNDFQFMQLSHCPSRFRTWTLLIQNHSEELSNYVKSSDFIGGSSVGALNSKTKCRTLPGETDPQTDPAIRKCMERTGIEPATSWLQTRRSPS